MKTLIILILLIALAAAAFFTRPSESSFGDLVKAQADAKTGNFLEKFVTGMSTDTFLKSCTYKDRFLWTEVQRDGKTIYIGAFSHWFEKGTENVKKTEGIAV